MPVPPKRSTTAEWIRSTSALMSQVCRQIFALLEQRGSALRGLEREPARVFGVAGRREVNPQDLDRPAQFAKCFVQRLRGGIASAYYVQRGAG
jgi:hypothetical protein